MVYEAVALAVTTLIFALIIMWETSLSMINKKNILGFFPFFSLSIVLTIYAGFIFFEFYFQLAWATLELLILLNLIWIFIVIRRENE
jgi:hypothetical protein